MLNLIKIHKNFKGYKFFKFEDNYNGREKTIPIYSFEHASEINENDKEMIFSACVKIKYDNKYGRKILKKMLSKQNSPIKLILQDNDADARAYAREGKKTDRYTVPEDILNMIREDEKKKD